MEFYLFSIVIKESFYLHVAICPTGARKITGKGMTVEDVMEIMMKDEVFYRHSGGGMTASGGEPLSQAKFV